MLTVLQLLWFTDSADLDPEPWGRTFGPLLVFIVMSAIYEVVFLRFNDGQTPGKDLLTSVSYEAPVVLTSRCREQSCGGSCRVLSFWYGRFGSAPCA